MGPKWAPEFAAGPRVQPWLLENVTVEDRLEHWLEDILPLSVRWRTRSGYASHLRVHVIPTIGAARLSELRPETLERLYRQLIEDGRSTHVVHGVHRVLRSSLNEAVRRQRLFTNPAALARPPRVERSEIEPLTADEWRAGTRRPEDPIVAALGCPAAAAGRRAARTPAAATAAGAGQRLRPHPRPGLLH